MRWLKYLQWRFQSYIFCNYTSGCHHISVRADLVDKNNFIQNLVKLSVMTRFFCVTCTVSKQKTGKSFPFLWWPFFYCLLGWVAKSSDKSTGSGAKYVPPLSYTSALCLLCPGWRKPQQELLPLCSSPFPSFTLSLGVLSFGLSTWHLLSQLRSK